MKPGKNHHIISSLAGMLPIEKLVQLKQHRIIFPFWHVVTNDRPAHLSQLYQFPSVSEFTRGIDFLQKAYLSIDHNQLSNFILNKQTLTKRYFYPSFDDGLSECFHVIAPLLKKKGIAAAFFINPAFVDNQTLFHRHKARLILNLVARNNTKSIVSQEAEDILLQSGKNQALEVFLRQCRISDHALLDRLAEVFEIDFQEYLARVKPYMTLEQILQLQQDGFLIGAHSMDHREFYEASEPEMINQIKSSIDFLVRKINPPLKTFAFPYTDFGVPNSVFEHAGKNGLWHFSFGTAGIKDDEWNNHLQRIPMETGHFSDARTRIRMEHLAYLIKKIVGKNKVRRQ